MLPIGLVQEISEGIVSMEKMTAGDSNRRPDEEGIKTDEDGNMNVDVIHSNRRPDEEGIKTGEALHYRVKLLHSNRRPDEEGIKTVLADLPNRDF